MTANIWQDSRSSNYNRGALVGKYEFTYVPTHSRIPNGSIWKNGLTLSSHDSTETLKEQHPQIFSFEANNLLSRIVSEREREISLRRLARTSVISVLSVMNMVVAAAVDEYPIYVSTKPFVF
jgi:hypothetical protein